MESEVLVSFGFQFGDAADQRWLNEVCMKEYSKMFIAFINSHVTIV